MSDHRYVNWADKWLITHDMLNCSECLAGQFMAQQNNDFVHGLRCSRRGPGQRPYLELLALLQAMQDELPDQR